MTKWGWVILTAMVLAVTVYFAPSFSNFFFQDDFFNITLSQSQNLLDAFNIFKKPILDFFFYRPLTTQTFWGILYPIFGFSPAPYHLVSFLFFLVNIFLVYYLALLITKQRGVSVLTAFLYAFNSTHFYRLFFLSQFQEIGFATFVLLTIIFFVRRSQLAILFFILSLTSKETAIVVPFFLLALSILYRRALRETLLPFAVLGFYLVARFLFFGFATGGAYVFNFGLKQAMNNYFWYGLWGLGIPESFVNLKLFWVSRFNDLGQFMGMSLFNTDVFSSFGIWGGPIVVVFLLFSLTILLGVRRKTVTALLSREIIFSLVMFPLFLLPVAFYPFHKFAYSLTIPVVGICLFLAICFKSFQFKFMLFGVIFYFLLNFFTLQYNFSHHWSTGKAYTAKTAFNYFQSKYKNLKSYKNVYFQNDDRNFCSTVNPGKDLSSEVAYGIGGLEGLRLLYNDPTLEIYFWDWDKNAHLLADSLILDSRLFLRR